MHRRAEEPPVKRLGQRATRHHQRSILRHLQDTTPATVSSQCVNVKTLSWRGQPRRRCKGVVSTRLPMPALRRRNAPTPRQAAMGHRRLRLRQRSPRQRLSKFGGHPCDRVLTSHPTGAAAPPTPYDGKKRERELKSLLDKLLKQECRVPGKWIEDIRKVKQKIEQLDEQRYRGALVRARAEDTAAGETPSKRALGLEKARAEKNHIREIEWGGVRTPFYPPPSLEPLVLCATFRARGHDMRPSFHSRHLLDGIVASIPACHAGDRGSIPRRGAEGERDDSATAIACSSAAFWRARQQRLVD
ncbi:hypothetical protein HPB50_014440 [Hyalomma asiaticum]|uniref:Uncharacterized protein n=1 Tax=Hyalomma asiaticum TaxID=266040 RepID=A0ACB7SNG5_HYAAI|nr:hypothetical protein HPB50_014440 [Hyalomma asiaticum]